MRLAGKPGAVSDLTKLDLVLPVAVAPTRAWYMLCACVQQPARGSHISADASAPGHQHLTVGEGGDGGEGTASVQGPGRGPGARAGVGRPRPSMAIVVAIVARAAVIATPET